ncbi:MAG TPA: FAD-dependent oxidoreductase [Beijerinckiaceae bacterium]|nr:FAD-dependent oxidoreductase [Beijerinckiaceae bacterium]
MSPLPPITFDVAIVGGGPGALMAAMHINEKVGAEAKVTIFEQSNRLGGKLMTRSFDKVPALYEAGVAEIYDYAHIGPDPLKELITGKLGLDVVRMDSECVVIGDKIINTYAEIERHLGKKASDAIAKFRKKCTTILSPQQYYEGIGRDDNDQEWLWKSGLDVLHDEVKDETARNYIRYNAHSDIAIAPNETSGLNACKNFLMDWDEYIKYYSVVGGNERITQRLSEIVRADVEMHSRVRRVGKAPNGKYRLVVQQNGKEVERLFDFVVVSLPYNWLATMEWEGERLYRALGAHLDHFNYPAHYLRVAILFEKPFWKDFVQGSWFMSDAFNGCCVYDESSRHDYGKAGALGWLIAGSDALAYANMPDDHLVRMALASLPPQLQFGRELMLEAKVVRWLNTVNGIPGGRPVRDTQQNHQPEPVEHPGLFVTGDYLFDATLNGVLDSADCASDMLMSEYVKADYEARIRLRTRGAEAAKRTAVASSRNVNRAYFENYWNHGPYPQAWNKFFHAGILRDSIRDVWGAGKTFSMLDAGSASGLTVQALRNLGLDAWGIEKNAWIHAQTPKDVRAYNKLGDVTELPFKDGQFDFVYESCLANLPRHKVQKAIRELHRVARKGIILGSVTSDLTWPVLIDNEMQRGVKTFATLWQWSDWLFNVGFDHAIEDDALLKRIWDRHDAVGMGKGGWFEDPESIRYCYFNRLDV